MSSTNKTAELQLSQFIGTDIPSILTDYNGDMRKIDAGVREVKQATAGAVSDLSSVTARVTNAEQSISGLNSTVQGIATRVVSAEGDIDNIQNLIPTNASVSNKLATVEDIGGSGAITSLQTRMTTAENDIDDIEHLIPDTASANNQLVDYNTFSNVEGGICLKKFESNTAGSTLLNLQNAWQQFKTFCDNNGIPYGNGSSFRKLFLNTIISVNGIMLRLAESFDGVNYNPEFYGFHTNGHGFYYYALTTAWGDELTDCHLYETDVNVLEPTSGDRNEITQERAVVIYTSMRPFVPSRIYS